MTPKWKDYRNPCMDFKFLVCALYVSKLSFRLDLLLLVYKSY